MSSNINKATIYYFSGTGNARRVSEWFAEKATGSGIEATPISIDQIDRRAAAPPLENELVGFIGPTHGFNYPPILMNFVLHFPRAKGANSTAFVANTRGGVKMGKRFMPGLSGITLLMAAITLRIKGYKVVGMRSIDLPSNWVSLHPALSEKVVASIFEHCRPIVEKFADRLLSGKTDFRALRDMPVDLLVLPISVLYYILGRFILAKTFYADSQCNECGICVEKCPIKAIKMVNHKPFWTYRCESCMRCMNSCPKKAIETGHGYLFALIFVTYATVIAWIWSQLATLVSVDKENIWVQLVGFIVESAIVFVVLALGYRVLHYLKRLPLLRQLVEYTSFTKWRFWGRYRGQKQQQPKRKAD